MILVYRTPRGWAALLDGVLVTAGHPNAALAQQAAAAIYADTQAALIPSRANAELAA